jgi:ribulose-phosphate 3-epimerase
MIDDVTIAASVLAGDPGNPAASARAAARAGVDWIHCDVMDGHFVPNLTFGPATVAALRDAVSLPLDVHLMVRDPDRWIEPFAAAGVDWLSVHPEATDHLHRTLQRIREAGVRPAVVLNPATPLVTLTHVLADVDMVVVMTVNPGFSGQRFLGSLLPKIRECRAMIATAGHPVRLAVDGGLDADTVRAAAGAGGDVLVAGSAVFGGNDPDTGVRLLREGLTDTA